METTLAGNYEVIKPEKTLLGLKTCVCYSRSKTLTTRLACVFCRSQRNLNCETPLVWYGMLDLSLNSIDGGFLIYEALLELGLLEKKRGVKKFFFFFFFFFFLFIDWGCDFFFFCIFVFLGVVSVENSFFLFFLKGRDLV